MITQEIITLTPELASNFLRSNSGNRPLSRNIVQLYSSAIKRGEWMLNGEAIAFDTSGRLVNGQHRCHAVIDAKQPINTAVVRGVDPRAFMTYDEGKRRTIGDKLGIAGEKNANVLAADARAFVQLETKVAARSAFTATQAKAVIDANPDLRFWAHQFAAGKSLKKLFTSPLVGVICLAARKYGEDPMMTFMNQLDTGVGLAADSPALMLRDKFLERTKGTAFTTDLCLAYYVKAVNAYVTKKPLKILRMKAAEQFPELV